MKLLNKYIDHTLLKPTATQSDIKQLCKEAVQYKLLQQIKHLCLYQAMIDITK